MTRHPEPPLDQMPCECDGCEECTDIDMCLEPKHRNGRHCLRCKRARAERARVEAWNDTDWTIGADPPRNDYPQTITGRRPDTYTY